MSIVFHCPDCGALIAFSDQHAGKRAHCVKCQQPFVIPDKSHNKAKTVTDSNRSKSIEKPVPGFYKAAFVTSWAVWFHLRSVTGLVFVMAQWTNQCSTSMWSIPAAGSIEEGCQVAPELSNFGRHLTTPALSICL